MSVPIRCHSEHEGELERIVLDAPKGNVLDLAMISAIRSRLGELNRERTPLKLLVFEGAGPHFSFGASVEEHLPDRVDTMLRAFHAMFREIESLGVPSAAIVRGQCLGGGMELAAWCGRVYCDPTARFGVPEVKLGVFPPIASIALPWRMGGARAADLILRGCIVDGPSAVLSGLADVCDSDPEGLVQRYFSENLAPRSAVALRFAWRAVRRPLQAALARELETLENLYLVELMSHRDPAEGIRAFLEKRDPAWTHS
jgi:cyclohexa-1,5-dienecarbonyl-CoA hydratase